MEPRRVFASLILSASINMTGCVTPQVYYLGVKDREIKFQEIHVAYDGDVLAVGQLIQRAGVYKRYAYKDARSLHEYLHVEPHRDGDVIRVAGSIGKPTDVTAWTVVPSDFRNQDATQDAFPPKFRFSSRVYSTASPVPYDDQGHRYYLQFRSIVGLGRERAPWSYVCQIFLPPAAAIDLALGAVWVPLWLIFFSHEH